MILKRKNIEANVNMHYDLWELLLIFVLWTLAAWVSVGAYLLIWEGTRPGGQPGNGVVKKQIAWFALKTAVIIGAAIAREYL